LNVLPERIREPGHQRGRRAAAWEPAPADELALADRASFRLACINGHDLWPSVFGAGVAPALAGRRPSSPVQAMHAATIAIAAGVRVDMAHGPPIW
jgi:hypothetical protein